MSGETKKLLPCPFCGGGADLEHYTVGTWDDPKDRYEVDCTRCNASIESQSTEAKAIEAWNRRAEQTVKVRPLEKRTETVMGWEGVCTNCGAYTIHEMDYCHNCGAKLEWGE